MTVDDDIKTVLETNLLSKLNLENLAYFRSCVDNDGIVSSNHLRASGKLVAKERLKQIGLRGNVKISEEFLDMLSEAGMADPLEAAHILASHFNTRRQTRKSLAAWQAVGGEFVKVLPSNMAAGPCQAVLAMGSRLPIEKAKIFPLLECNKIGQCACRYQSVLNEIE